MRGQGTYVKFQDVNWSKIKSLIPYLFEFRRRVFLAVLCLIGAKLASVVLPFILKHIVDNLDLKGQDLAIGLPIALLLAYGAVRFANVFFGELRDALFGRVTERAMRRVGLKVFEHLHSLDLQFHLNRRTGGLARDIERGNSGISFILRFLVFNIVPTLFEIGMVVFLLAWNYHYAFALIVLLAVVFYVGYSVIATEWRTKYVRLANQAESQTSTRAVDSLLNFETVKYFNNEDYESKLYDRDLKEWENARRKNRLTLFALNGGQALIIAISMTSAMTFAAMGVVDGSMSLGDFVLINAFMMQIFLPLNFLGFVYREMKGAMANVERMFELLDEEAKITDKAEAIPLVVNRGEVVFDKVCFSYDQRPILKNVSFTIPPGENIALVGPSGAGKSTIAKLVFRLFDPSSGSIYIDGSPISNVTQDSLRSALAVVPQDTVLFNSSIRENIQYGNIAASDTEIMKAVEHAHLLEFIDKLPKGIDTMVGERGLKLSGGEKQRVAIARALLKNPKIMIFDEATSSLDSKSERAILAAIESISRHQSTLTVAHRLSTVVNAHRIYVLDNGEIVEYGTHEELLKKSQGRYAAMWALQQSSKD